MAYLWGRDFIGGETQIISRVGFCRRPDRLTVQRYLDEATRLGSAGPLRLWPPCLSTSTCFGNASCLQFSQAMSTSRALPHDLCRTDCTLDRARTPPLPH